ncbi:MAG: DUF1800 domain-containing protein [Terracidiphilus sp.]
MKAIKGPLALSLCCTLCSPLGYSQQAPQSQPSPKSPTRSEYQSTQLRGDDRILHALNRFTFGPRPGDLEAVRAMGQGNVGLEKWFDQQLHPASIDESTINARLAQFPEMQWNTEDLLYRLPSNAEIRQAMNTGRVPIPANGTLHAIYENQIYRIQSKKDEKAQRAATPQSNVQAGGPQATSAPANMQLASDGNMVRVDANGNPVANSENSISPSSGSDTSPSAMSTATQPMSSSAQPTSQRDMNAPPPAQAQPAFDEASIRQILALPPEQRVSHLAAMQPEEFDGFIKSLKPPQRVTLNANLSPELKLTVAALENPERLVSEDLISARLTRDIYANAQLQEVMTDFWLNHFNVYLRKNEQMPYYLVGYERDTIRPRSLGKFEDLLEAVAHSPAMLAYLDNAQSIGPSSLAAERAEFAAARRPSARKQAPEGLNENYARELMELHTLGVNGGYTQADVTQVARVLTGWTIDRPLIDAQFSFNPNRHEPGTKKVLGKKIKENGEMEGRELLHMLATSPATAHFISRELAIRFVSDDPPQSLVDRMAKSYLSSDGDIPAVLKTLFHSPEFWSSTEYRAKVKTPLEFVVSAARASNAEVENVLPLANNLRQMGMPVYGSIPPTGYDWKASTWISTGALVDRMNFALNLAANRLPGITINWTPLPDLASADPVTPSTPESEETRLEPQIIPGGATGSTRSAALQQFAAQSAQNNNQPSAPAAAQQGAAIHPIAAAARRNNRAPNPSPQEKQDQLLAGLLIGSPDFQRR